MEIDRSRLREDLQGIVDGTVRCDDAYLQLYASDASIFQQLPLAVVHPTNVDDVVQCMRYAAEHQISVTPRGAASNVIGACIGSGIMLDFSSAMRRVISVDPESVTVEPGVVLADLNRELRSLGRRFGPDPVNRRVSTIGGAVSLNASGSKWLKYSTVRDKVLQLKVVLASGELATLNSRVRSGSPTSENADHLEAKVASIVGRYRAAIEARKPSTKINQAGYNLFDLDSNGSIDLTRLVAGSEGTLAIVVEATLQTDVDPPHRGVSLLSFDSLDAAAKAAVEIGRMGVVACDLIDRRLLTLACETNPEFLKVISSDAESVLLVEFEADDHGSLQARLEHLRHRIQSRKKLAFDVRSTTQEAERNFFWRLTRRIIPALYRLKGERRALPFIEDIAVDPLRLPEFLKQLHRTLNEFDVTASIFSHTPQGLIHVRPFLNLADPNDLRRMKRLAETMFERTIEFGGTISGAHGDGLSRSWFLRRQFGELYNPFVAVKKTFDPLNLLNPGIKIDSDQTGLPANTRPVEPSAGESNGKAEATVLPVVQPELPWSVAEIGYSARNCNGCARCRTDFREERMCPMFRAAPVEEASPRAKANLMRSVVTGQIPVESMATEEFRQIVELCVHCHQCRIDCPASVDVPKLMVEAKANYYRVNGFKFSDRLMTRLDWLLAIAGRAPRISNVLIRNRTARMLLDRFLGIARGRKLPRFATRSFTRWVNRNRLRNTNRQQSHKICYFVDAFVTWHDAELGRSLVNIFKHNGIDVVVPDRQSMSGMTMISEGAIAPARKLATRNIETLAEYVRQGYRIVTTEPSAALALRHEYPNLLDDRDAELVADNTTDACSMLLELHRSGELELDFKPLNYFVGYHLPCHQRVFTADPPSVRLLKLIPGLQVEILEQGCSGMAGTWGVKSKNYKRSLKMGFGLINAVRNSPIIAGTTECSTCKIQMEQGTAKPTIHPIKIIALAYGLMPELEGLFQRRSDELVTS